MKAITWAPGTNKELDSLFDSLREERTNDTGHRLWKNYSKEYFFDSGIVALTMSFDENDNPMACASIASRECWPEKVYRIYNRAWKIQNKISFLKEITVEMGSMAHSQIDWLNENTDCQMYFISRQSDTDWRNWMIRNFKRQYNLLFYTTENKYLTCPNECDDTCWQYIIYNGNKEKLLEWQQK